MGFWKKLFGRSRREETEQVVASLNSDPAVVKLKARIQRSHQKLESMARKNRKLKKAITMIGTFPTSLETKKSLDGRPMSYLEIGQALQVFSGELMALAHDQGRSDISSAAQELESISREIARL